MSGPGDAPPIEHVAPKDFPVSSLVGVQVPTDFNKVIVAAAARNGMAYADQLLLWAQKGAECERLHGSRPVKSGRTKRP